MTSVVPHLNQSHHQHLAPGSSYCSCITSLLQPLVICTMSLIFSVRTQNLSPTLATLVSSMLVTRTMDLIEIIDRRAVLGVNHHHHHCWVIITSWELTQSIYLSSEVSCVESQFLLLAFFNQCLRGGHSSHSSPVHETNISPTAWISFSKRVRWVLTFQEKLSPHSDVKTQELKC